MKAESRALLDTLLAQHRHVCVETDGRFPAISACVIPYGRLCATAGVPHLTHFPGRFLQEIAEWCRDHGHPPINSLAINEEEGHPGSNYDLAPNCSLLTWQDEVTATIEWRRYPDHGG